LAAFRVLVEQHDCVAPGIIEDALRRETDPGMKVWELRLIGMSLKAGASDTIDQYLDDPDAGVRAAAADAMGIMYGFEGHPELTSKPTMTGVVVPTTASDPPIGLYDGYPDPRYASRWNRPVVGTPMSRMPERVRRKLRDMITNGVNPAERRAAAQAAAGYAPPGYRLRLAEWGVWLERAGAGDGRLQGVLSDIPGFVHATGDSVASLRALAAQRESKRRRATPAFMIVTKPVIHLTANVPLSLKLNVSFQLGRPWFAYPIPDCYSGPVRPLIPEPKELDPGTLGQLGPQMRWGYDWLINPAALKTPGGVAAGVDGVAWENLIVTPVKEGWMRPAEVGGDAKFDWWRRLREVECSWVNNGDESERFLYYDGPTMLRCPVTFAWEKGRVVVRGATLAAGEKTFLEGQKITTELMRHGLLITVQDGEATARSVSIPLTEKEAGGKWPVSLEARRVPGKADEVFLRAIVGRGLSDSEARGMAASWRKAFFKTEGVRLLMFLSAEDYGVFCPLEVTPAPTEMARVGVIWVEL
jgi:hypothetical protein